MFFLIGSSYQYVASYGVRWRGAVQFKQSRTGEERRLFSTTFHIRISLIAGASSGGEEEHLKSVLVIYFLFLIIYVRVRVICVSAGMEN